MAEKYISYYDKMTRQPIPSLLVQLSIPTVISMMVTNVYNMADTAFVGQLGTSASGAVGVVFGYMSIIQAVGFMFGQGSGSMISRSLGQKNQKEASIVCSTAIFYCLLFGLVISIGSFFWMDELVMLLGSTETIAPYAINYTSYIMLAAPVMAASFSMNNILRYEGKAMLGMIGMMTGAVLNIALDPILIFGFGMGISGAGLATCLSQYISFGILISMFLRGKTQCKLAFSNIDFRFRKLSDIATTGFPSMLRQILNSLATVMLNQSAAPFGDAAVAAMSIVGRVTFFVFAISLGIGQGFQPISGFNYGAKQYKRLRKAFWTTVVMASATMIVLSLIVIAGSGAVIQIFRDDPQVIEIGTRALRLQLWAEMVLPGCMVVEMLHQSTGRKGGATLLSSMRGGLLFIPAIVILSRLRGLAGIQEAQPLAYLLAVIPAVIMGIRYFKSIPNEDIPPEIEAKS